MTLPRVLELADPHYPKALRSLPQPPPILHVQGRLELLERPGIAVVGTRRHTTYGRDATVSLVLGLVRAGYVILSGLARGIDSIAHRTALDVGGDTVGVLGTGLDLRYPPEHEDLAELMAERGCLVTEFPPGTPPLRWICNPWVSQKAAQHNALPGWCVPLRAWTTTSGKLAPVLAEARRAIRDVGADRADRRIDRTVGRNQPG
jgi:hypothetical protein